jgi:hypothetical protein
MKYLKSFEGYQSELEVAEICKEYRLNFFLEEIGLKPVEKVDGYNNI